MMIPKSWFFIATNTIAPYINTTPLTNDKDNNIYIKWENHQVTGSFKARGALNKILQLEKWEQDAGLLAASAGNHGQGVAYAGKLLGIPVTIYVPEKTPKVKIQAIKSFGAQVILVSGGYCDAEAKALIEASKASATWISPYNDGKIIAGQGTVASECLDQLSSLDDSIINKTTWLIPTSGGGLLSGCALILKNHNPGIRVIGVQAETSPFMYSIYHHNTQENIFEKPTIAEGLAGPVENGSITIPIIKEYVDDIVLVDEKEIAQGVSYAWQHYKERIEGSAAVVFSALLTGKITAKPLVLIISGGNIDHILFEKIIKTNV